MGLFDFLKNPESKKTKIIKMFYSDYPETPFISDERDFSNWIERAKNFPKQSLVDRKMMTRYDDGLLPGHIYMLYWLKKYKNKKVPIYFEYKYGIDFEKEKFFLIKNGYLDNNSKPSESGEYALAIHHEIIEAHSQPKPNVSCEDIRKSILESKKQIVKNGFKEYSFHANRNCCETCATLNGKHFPISSFKIGVNAPPMHDGCRCSISAYEDETEYEAWLNNL